MKFNAKSLNHQIELYGSELVQGDLGDDFQNVLIGSRRAGMKKLNGGIVNHQTKEAMQARLKFFIRYETKFENATAIKFKGVDQKVIDITNHEEQNRWQIFEVETNGS